VAERVAARIAVGRGVRHRADAYAVESDQYDSLERCHEGEPEVRG